MNYQELDEFVDRYGFSNQTEIDDKAVAMTVTAIRKEKNNGNAL